MDAHTNGGEPGAGARARDAMPHVRYAERYAALGFPVLPIEPNGKRPLWGQGIEHATTDSERIRSWFDRKPDANIGIRLDNAGLLAVDIDPRNGGDLGLARGLPATLTADTGGGGMHLLYRARGDLKLPGKLCAGVDLKYKGYIVVAPSLHPSGHAYMWRDWNVLDGELPAIAEAPEDVFLHVSKDQHSKRGQALCVIEGGRNDYLSRQAFKLRKNGLSARAIEGALIEINRAQCSPPLPESEVRAIAAGKSIVTPAGVTIDDFYAHMPSHSYLFVPARELWPAASVNGRCTWPTVDGKPVSPASILDKERAVEQLVWSPGEPEIIRDRVMQVSGWVAHQGTTVFNLYRQPTTMPGDSMKAGPWIEHVRRVYPEDADHIIQWLAHRVQYPGVKCNHALVLGGLQGVGKDTLLEPVKTAVGPWNWSDIGPTQMIGRFNGWAKAVVVRVSEARDLGDVDRFAFYDHSKTYIAAPPDVLRVDEKHLRETYVANVCGVVVTTNHASDGLFLPADDRRHYVAWSPRTREESSC